MGKIYAPMTTQDTRDKNSLLKTLSRFRRDGR
jgi:hypothetical protein